MQTISTVAKEQSTYIVTVAFQDEDGTAVAPKTLKWSWADRYGTAINSRTNVAVASPAASNDIVLSGDDLEILTAEVGHDYVERRFIVEATYDGSLGSDLPVNDQAEIILENLTKVS